MMRTHCLLLTAVLVSLQINSCATNPVTGEKELRIISESQEIAMGEEYYPPTRQAQGGRYIVDPSLTKYVSSIGQRLANVSDRPRLPYEFVVLNNSVPNAWALPGGKIAVNRGLLVELQNEAELAAVIGHEIVHAAARHGAKSMERGLLLSVGVAGVAIATGDKDYAGIAMGAAAIGTQLISQKYSRDAELEADKYGMRYMARAGYDPSAAIGLQQTFVRLAEGRQSNWLEGLFASHPPSQERVEANRSTARELGAKGTLGKAAYQTQIAYLLQTKPAYDALDQGHKALKENKLDKALALAEKAIQIEPREALFYGLRGDVYKRQKRLSDAEASYSEAISRNGEFFLFYLQRGLVREQLNNLDAARGDLNKSLDYLPTAPAYYALGNIALKQGDRQAAREYYAKASASEGEMGKQASIALAKLEIQSEPQKYLSTQLVRTATGAAAVTVKNRSPIAVNNVILLAQLYSASGAVLKREKISYAAPIPPGAEKHLPLRILNGLLEPSQRISVTIVEAAAVE